MTATQKRLEDIKQELEDISNLEAYKLYKLAHRAERHGVSAETVHAIREEANTLHMNAYPERLLDPFNGWKYGFKYAFKF